MKIFSKFLLAIFAGILGCGFLFSLNIVKNNLLSSFEIDPEYFFSSSKIAFNQGDESCSCGSWGSWEEGNCNEGGCIDKRVKVRNRDCNPAGCQEESQILCIDDPTCVLKSDSQNTILSPNKISGSYNSKQNVINLSWRASKSSDISGYFILRKLTSDNYYDLVGTVTQNTLSFQDDSIEKGGNYNYSIVSFKGRSFDDSLKSDFSEAISISAGTAKNAIKEDKKAKENLKNNNQVELSLTGEGKLKTKFSQKFFNGRLKISISENAILRRDNEITEGEIRLLVSEIKDTKKYIKEEDSEYFIPETIFEVDAGNTNFSEPAEFKIEYGPLLVPAGKSEESIVIKYFDDGSWKRISSKVYPEKNYTTGEVSHFSIFALFTEEDLLTSQEPDISYEKNFQAKEWIILFAAILVIFGVLIYAIKKKKRNK